MSTYIPTNTRTVHTANWTAFPSTIETTIETTVFSAFTTTFSAAINSTN